MTEEKTLDLVLHDAIQENLDLLNKLKPLFDLLQWIKVFMLFTMLVLVIVVMKLFNIF